jgi:hypothetical protein
VDVIALARGGRPRTAGVPIAFLGEAKCRDRRPGIAELRRLEHVAELLNAAGHDATSAVFGMFSTRGFTEELAEEARLSDGRLLLAGLDTLYGE